MLRVNDQTKLVSEHLKTGGCLCGSVRYEAKPRSDSAYYCHCRDCQIGSSSAFTVAVYSAEDDFRLTAGELAAYTKSADSGRSLSRMFCPECGTPLIWTGEGFPGAVLVSLSSLDDPEAFAPVHEGWTDSALSWCRIRDDIESFSGRPVRGF
jgi:hypothetical protein